MTRYALMFAAAAALVPTLAFAQIQDSISEIPCHPTDRLLDHVCANIPFASGTIAVAPALPVITLENAAPPVSAAITPAD